ncbi:MAG: polymer-forming cytoskeletal protein [Spirochaetaceae bacterium]
MAEIHSQRVRERELDTVMGLDIDFAGSLSFSDPLMIKGKLKGDINATGVLYIEATATVQANISAASVQIRGEVIGDINATKSVQLFSSAKVTGDIVAPKVKMENGCFFSGKCQMTGKVE